MRRRLIGWDEVINTVDGLRTAVMEARRRDHLNLREAGERSGVPFNSISRFERGQDITLSNAVALMRWLAGARTDLRQE